MSMKLKLRAIPLAIACTVLATSAFSAESHIGPMREFAQSTARTWVADPVVINAIKKQNAKHADLSQADIDDLDKTWRAETGRKVALKSRPTSAPRNTVFQVSPSPHWSSNCWMRPS